VYYDFGMTTTLQAITVKLPLEDVRRIPRRNRSAFVREAVSEKLNREGQKTWQPQTELGRDLWRRRQEFLAGGGQTLDAAGIAAELRERRGGLA